MADIHGFLSICKLKVLDFFKCISIPEYEKERGYAVLPLLSRRVSLQMCLPTKLPEGEGTGEAAFERAETETKIA
jgi:hypothetical protein